MLAKQDWIKMDQVRPDDSLPEIKFPTAQGEDIGVFECRVYFPDGWLKRIHRARTVAQVLADKMQFNLYITEKLNV